MRETVVPASDFIPKSICDVNEDRIHVLKLMGSFPTLKIIEDIETQ